MCEENLSFDKAVTSIAPAVDFGLHLDRQQVGHGPFVVGQRPGHVERRNRRQQAAQVGAVVVGETNGVNFERHVTLARAAPGKVRFDSVQLVVERPGRAPPDVEEAGNREMAPDLRAGRRLVGYHPLDSDSVFRIDGSGGAPTGDEHTEKCKLDSAHWLRSFPSRPVRPPA